jgi:hypothetical protein
MTAEPSKASQKRWKQRGEVMSALGVGVAAFAVTVPGKVSFGLLALFVVAVVVAVVGWVRTDR